MAARLAVLSVPQIRVPLLVTSGMLGAAAFPTTNWSLFAWVWLAPAFACALTRPPRGALADGWLAGTVFFLVLLRWLDHTFSYYSAIPWPVAWLFIAALAGYCGLYVGGVAAGVARLRLRWGAGWALTALPVLWVAGEWMRGRLLGGFPWGLLGYSQHGDLAVIQIAELTGVYGVSFLVVAVNAAVAGTVALRWRALPGVVAVLMLLSGTLLFGVFSLETETPQPAEPTLIRVVAIQPSIEQSLKWDRTRREETLAVLERLTRQAGQSRPALIVWPETAVPAPLPADPDVLARVRALSREVATALLVGSLDRAASPPWQPLNSAFLIEAEGIRAKYDKIRLVPFGERDPLLGAAGLVRPWAEFISELAAGDVRTVFSLPGAAFGTAICYEGIFPELVREFVAGGAGFMVNISNDAWFGRTSGPWQHLAMLPLRAVENRVAIARAANTGISAFVDPTGRVIRTLPLFERGLLEGALPVRTRITVYTRFGDWFAYACLGLSVAAVVHRVLAEVLEARSRDRPHVSR
ncbi:MAG: apolipoprotein N-acyltransferase [Candidatus Rokubacteria bacterium]|nr:apolipoprotein N-acyltransferase [Candidatus Rokubacteria bacterium]MBI3108161.1 apolipoprotein N-acyltransferase [Candidatus Rokubacteria bacterium]